MRLIFLSCKCSPKLQCNKKWVSAVLTNLALSKGGDGILNVHNNLNVCSADEDKKGNDKYAHMYADSIEL